MICREIKNFRSSKIEISGTLLKITVAGISFTTLPNLTRFNLILCQNLPAGSNFNEVVLSDGTTDVVAYNLSGNLLRADQIKCRRCYPMIYGNDKQHVSMQKYLCNTAFTIPEPTPNIFLGKKG